MNSERKPVDVAIDLFFYAPVGASIEFWERVPELAKLGRERLSAQAPAARMIGQFVLGVGRSRMESRLGEAAKRGREAVGNYRSVARSETASESHEHDGRVDTARSAVPSIEIPIPHYDGLTALVIVPLLDDLSAEEREMVRRHEIADRGRRTILAKIDRLDAADSVEA